MKSLGPKGSRKKNNPKTESSNKTHVAEKPVIERIESAVKPEAKQDNQTLSVERQPEAMIEPAVQDRSKDIIRELVDEDMHSRFLAQQEVTPVYTPVRPEEIFTALRMSEETARHFEEPTAQVAHEATMREAVPKPVDSEPVLAAYEATFINTEVVARLDDIAEVAEPTEMSESLMEYDLLEEDDVISLMAGFEQRGVVIEENGELPVVEISADTEVPKFTPAEIQVVASVPELPAPVEEIEAAITTLAEALESKEVLQILEDIITLPDALGVSTVEAEEAVEDKLKVLFIRLFEETGTLYTPELVESFVKLTQAHYLKELLPVATETGDDTGALPHEIGTREFLQKLHHGLGAMKQAVFHCYEIGKSVLRVYGLAGAVPEFTV